jgi:hypothetical protein
MSILLVPVGEIDKKVIERLQVDLGKTKLSNVR